MARRIGEPERVLLPTTPVLAADDLQLERIQRSKPRRCSEGELEVPIRGNKFFKNRIQSIN
jgi:hypothetical protein